MKKFSKALALLLALVMILSMAACEPTESENPSGDPSASQPNADPSASQPSNPNNPQGPS